MYWRVRPKRMLVMTIIALTICGYFTNSVKAMQTPKYLRSGMTDPQKTGAVTNNRPRYEKSKRNIEEAGTSEKKEKESDMDDTAVKSAEARPTGINGRGGVRSYPTSSETQRGSSATRTANPRPTKGSSTVRVITQKSTFRVIPDGSTPKDHTIVDMTGHKYMNDGVEGTIPPPRPKRPDEIPSKTKQTKKVKAARPKTTFFSKMMGWFTN